MEPQLKKYFLTGMGTLWLLGLMACGDGSDTPFDRPLDTPIFDPGPPPALPNNPPTGNTSDSPSNPPGTSSPEDSGQTPNPPPDPIITGVRCTPNARGEFPRQLAMDQGHRATYDWSQAEGCIGRPLREVWAVLHNQGLLAWEEVYKIEAHPIASLPSNVAFGYQIKYFVDDFIDVDWTMQWYHSLVGGTIKKPLRLVINYKKVSGTRYISYWEGSIVLDYVAPKITSFKARDQIDASRTTAEDSANGIRDVYRKLSEGAPVWSPLGGS